jgi:hypothetical protein
MLTALSLRKMGSYALRVSQNCQLLANCQQLSGSVRHGGRGRFLFLSGAGK